VHRDPAHPPLIGVEHDSAGYTMELGLSWDKLMLEPLAGRSIGFNLVNSDREARDGVVFTGSWAGISDLLHHNPSEWGVLLLYHRDYSWLWLFLLVPAAAVVAWFVRKGRKRRAPLDPARLSPVLRDVYAFLEKEYANENLDSQTVAKSVNLSGPYLGRIIKRETSRNFREFLNLFRIRKAKALLVDSNLTISEVAYKAGFSSPSQFSQVFQRFEHTAPSQFRKKHKQDRS
jgi:AraC-like DNA-binding protein